MNPVKIVCTNDSAFQAVLLELVDLAAVLVVYPDVRTFIVTPSFVVDVKTWLQSRSINTESVAVFELLKASK